MKLAHAVLWMSFVNVLAFSIMFPVVPVFVRRAGLPDVAFGLVTGAYFLSLFFGSMLMGRLADTHGKKRILLLSNIGTLAGWLVMLLASFFTGWLALALLLLSRAVDGLTGGNNSILQALVAESSKPSERTRAFGRIGATFGLGLIVGPAIGGHAYELFGLAGPAVFSIAVTLVSIAMIWKLVPGSPSGHAGRFSFRRNIRPLALRFASSFVFSSFTTIFPLLLLDRFGLGASSIGFVFVAVGLMSIFNQWLVVPAVEARLGAKASLVLASVLVGLGFVSAYFSHTVPALLLSNYLFNLGGIMFVPIIKSMLSKSGNLGAAMGADESARALSRAVAPVIASWLYQLSGPAALLAMGPAGSLGLGLLAAML